MSRFDPSCIDVLDYLECLDIRNVERATDKEVRFSCPYPAHIKGDESPSAYMNLETSSFFCHSCKTKGNGITVAADILGVSPIAAIRMLKQRYSPAGINPDSRSMVEEIRKILHKEPVVKRVNEPLPERVLDAYKVDWPTRFAEWHEGAAPGWVDYLLGERDFEPEWLMDWQFGYSDRFRRITLPIRDEKGRLVGIKARAWTKGHRPKYLNLRDDDNGVVSYLKNDIVFALDRVPSDTDTLIIVEGELNAIVMHELGYRNTVAINGSYFGERQIRLIKKRADKAILFFDSDSAGFEAARAVADVLLPFIFVDVVPDHIGDPAEMHPYSVERCLDEARGYMEAMLTRS